MDIDAWFDEPEPEQEPEFESEPEPEPEQERAPAPASAYAPEPAPAQNHREAAVILFADDRSPLCITTSKGYVNVSLTLREGAQADEVMRLIVLFKGAIEAGLLIPRGYATGDPALAEALRENSGQAAAPAKVTPPPAKTPPPPANAGSPAKTPPPIEGKMSPTDLEAAFERLGRKKKWPVTSMVRPVDQISLFSNEKGRGLIYHLTQEIVQDGRSRNKVWDMFREGVSQAGRRYRIDPLQRLFPEIKSLFEKGAFSVQFETPLYVRFEVDEYVNVKELIRTVPSQDGGDMDITPVIAGVDCENEDIPF